VALYRKYTTTLTFGNICQGALLPAVADVGDIPVIALGYDTPEPPIMGVAPFDVQAFFHSHWNIWFIQ